MNARLGVWGKARMEAAPCKGKPLLSKRRLDVLVPFRAVTGLV